MPTDLCERAAVGSEPVLSLLLFFSPFLFVIGEKTTDFEEANQHHTETMRALEILIERTARN